MGTDSPYAVLGLDEDASGDLVRRAFRTRAQATHPDHGGRREDFEAVVSAFRSLAPRLARRRRTVDPYRVMVADLDYYGSLTFEPATVRPEPGRNAQPMAQSEQAPNGPANPTFHDLYEAALAR